MVLLYVGGVDTPSLRQHSPLARPVAGTPHATRVGALAAFAGFEDMDALAFKR